MTSQLRRRGKGATRLPAFQGSFTQQEPIDDDAIAAAVSVMRSGRLHRYNTVGGEAGEAALLEAEYARYQGSRFCLACSSGGFGLQVALRAAGLQPGEPVLTNAFTLPPVPSAVVGTGGRPVFVETTPDLTPDFDDLRLKARESGARIFLVSHMRGHLPDMEALSQLVGELGLTMIEDCAHTMGAAWNGRNSGNFGHAAVFSTQTYKHMNSGEGGLVTSSDETFMARAILMSGSYMLYERHGAAPDAAVFADLRCEVPNYSGRMDNLRAAILRRQLATLDGNIERWNDRYRTVESRLRNAAAIDLPVRSLKERYVGSSIQFRVPGITPEQAGRFLAACSALGVQLKWFGNAAPAAYTSTHMHWRYVEDQPLPATDAVLAELFDMRIPLTFSNFDCTHIGDIIVSAVEGTLERGADT